MKAARYPVPWDLVFSLTPHLRHRTRASFDAITAEIVRRLPFPPCVSGLENLPEDPRFLLAANHHQRPGLWIAHTASLLTHAVRQHYGPGDPPVRWVVTANWPPLRIGPLRMPSPGDVLLPRVADTLSCYAVPFAGSNPRATAAAFRRLLRHAGQAQRPIGIFPEGAAGRAGSIGPPLAGVERLIALLARQGWPVVPACVTEAPGLSARFGQPLSPATLLDEPDAAVLVMEKVRELRRTF